MVSTTTYDYILTGGGASGLLLALRFAEDAFFDDKKVLIIDASAKDQNDRTWCFWSQQDTFIQNVVSHQWEKAEFMSSSLTTIQDLSPYTYNRIKSIDFYKYAREIITAKENMTWVQQHVKGLQETEDSVEVSTNESTYLGKTVFNSIDFAGAYKSSKKYPLVNQHFIGWIVKTNSDVFDPTVASFMDFDIPQKGNTRFMYVLPTSTNEALLEYTLFSKSVLPNSEYVNGIKEYLTKLGVTSYDIVEKEAGCIPMTSYPFWEQNTKRINHIGIAGGWAKASTGYTFHNSVLKTKLIVDQIKSQNPIVTKKKDRFWLYDLLLLDILYKHNEKGAAIFSAMFSRNSFQNIFAFLDEDTSLINDLKIISSVPKLIFTKTLFNRLFRRR